jgi:hypothetical protein
MKKRSFALLLVLLALGAAPALPCTVFLIARDGVVLAGNNEDWTDPDTKVWFVVAENEKQYGRVYFGFGNWFPQGGMNEAGLFFDGLALNGKEDPQPAGKRKFRGYLADKAMKTCADVDEVIALFEKWDLGFGNAQLMFGDAQGQSVVIERGVMHAKSGEFQVSTNFRLSRKTPEESGCRRYAAASKTLAEAKEATIDTARVALERSHQSITLYSNVYDLVNRDVYLWLNHDFDTVVQFNLDDELAQGDRRMDLPAFFDELAEE